MRKLVLFLLLVSVAAWAGPWKIDAGVGVGALTLGGNSVAAAKLLGQSSSIKLINGLNCVRDEGSGLDFQYDPANGKIVMVTVTKAQSTVGGQPASFAGDGGITIGSSIPQVELAYGKADVVRDLKTGKTETPMVYYAYTKKGIGFQFRGTSLVEIHVFPKH